MGGNSASTPQGNGSQLSSLFAGNGGYQQTPVAPISAPQPPGQALTPEQAAAATMARMQARTPMQAPKRAQMMQPPNLNLGPNGRASDR